MRQYMKAYVCVCVCVHVVPEIIECDYWRRAKWRGEIQLTQLGGSDGCDDSFCSYNWSAGAEIENRSGKYRRLSKTNIAQLIRLS